MLKLNAYLSEDRLHAALEFPDTMLTLTADQLDDLMEILADVRSRMEPPPGDGDEPASVN